jgi:hypothetical protein
MEGEDEVWIVISFKTAEYLAILCGQNNWGNPRRAGEAAHELGQAMGNCKMLTSLDCFSPHKKER